MTIQRSTFSWLAFGAAAYLVAGCGPTRLDDRVSIACPPGAAHATEIVISPNATVREQRLQATLASGLLESLATEGSVLGVLAPSIENGRATQVLTIDGPAPAPVDAPAEVVKPSGSQNGEAYDRRVKEREGEISALCMASRERAREALIERVERDSNQLRSRVQVGRPGPGFDLESVIAASARFFSAHSPLPGWTVVIGTRLDSPTPRIDPDLPLRGSRWVFVYTPGPNPGLDRDRKQRIEAALGARESDVFWLDTGNASPLQIRRRLDR